MPDAVRAQVEEKLACAKRLLHKVHELVEDEGHLLAIDKLKSVQGHVEERIVVLQAMLASLGGDDGGERTMPAEPSDVFGYFTSHGGDSLERVTFRVNQLRDRLANERRLQAALREEVEWEQGDEGEKQEDDDDDGDYDGHDAGLVPHKGHRWKITERSWQRYLSQRGADLCVRALEDYQKYYPLDAIPPRQYPSRPLSGTLKIKIHQIDFQDHRQDSLIVQIWVDGSGTVPVKFKRRELCDLVTSGIQIECNRAQQAEIQIFDKAGGLLGFLAFRLSWLEDHLPLVFGRTVDEQLDLVPTPGTIRLSLSIRKMDIAEDKTPLEAIIKRQGAIKRQFKMILGHEMAQKTHSSVVLKCAHCQEIIYPTGLQCSKCRFTCHKRCARDIYIRCLANPQYREWEEMTTELVKDSHPHSLQEVSVRAPCFCAHCGHIIPIAGPADENFKCQECGIYVHGDCEAYLPSLCGLDRGRALQISQSYLAKSQQALLAQSSIHSSKPSLWTPHDERQFEFVAVLGKGNFGKVILARRRETGEMVALKMLKKGNIIDNDERESILAERNVFALIASEGGYPFLVSCHGVYQTKTRLVFVMEFVGGGDLMFQIQRHRFSEEQARFFAAQVLLALEYLHGRDVIYRDLKLDNILLGLDGYIKLADYGLCKGEMAAASVTQTFCGTPEFMAPEILQDLPYTRAVDWWAFGVLVYELLFAHAPFQGRTEQAVFRAILSGRLAFPPDARSSAKDLIRRLLTKDPETRLGGRRGAAEIKKHPFFKGVDFGRLAAKKLDPPFKPTLTSPCDVSNFDHEFTSEPPILTPTPSIRATREYEQFFTTVIKGSGGVERGRP